MRKPTTNRVTQTAAQHGYEATDYSFQPDHWVYAPQAGTITDVTLNAGACGKRIILTVGSVQYYMCHFQDVAVNVGQKVAEGAKLGIMGETGTAFGRHLHLVILVNGVRVKDPDAWLNSKIGTGGTVSRIPDQDNFYWRYNKAMLSIRGRNMPRTEFRKNFVGRTHLQMLETMLDNREATRATEAQQWALKNRAAVEKQIADLKKALENEKSKPPKEVIKEVEKIVEKEVIKEVKVGEEEAVRGFFERLLDLVFRR